MVYGSVQGCRAGVALRDSKRCGLAVGILRFRVQGSGCCVC